MSGNAAAIRQQALARAAAGDDAGAARLFEQGLAAFPGDAAFANSAGNFHARTGRPDLALALFDRALALRPDLHEAEINRAVVLPRLGRAGEAAAALTRREGVLANVPRYWTTRAAAEVAHEYYAGAARSYDTALRREPGNARAARGRARVALERGEANAVEQHERALAANPGDPQLLRDYANALAGAGRADAALAISSELVRQLPGWIDGLELHAALRFAHGDGAAFADHFAAGARAASDPALYRSWAAMLAGVDRHGDAADVLASARARWPVDPALAFDEAVAAGEAGDDARAMALLDTGQSDPQWRIAEARQRLRQGEPAAAERLLALALVDAPHDVAGWALCDLCWRLLGDARHDWLHGEPLLIREIELDLTGAQLSAARDLLDRLHERAGMPIGQSVRQGSQTRGALFQRTETEIAAVAAAVGRAIDTYRATLPPADPSHPLLRHRDSALRITGSWSIQLDGVGHHAAHIHPLGILSSAAYLAVPAQVADAGRPGCLELGRPPASLRIDLPPLTTIVPREGHCALFPSTLYHGTRPIASGRRMTVAFDVTAAG